MVPASARRENVLRATSFALVTLLFAAAAPAVPLTIVGTNDLHGHVERVAALAGHVDVLRRRAAENGGAVLLVDAGDMFQGTLESNLGEGGVVVAAYNAVGYDAVAIGNHELDYGPVGPRTTATAAGDDPRGALRARATEARFPFLAANILDAATGKPAAWKNVAPSTIVSKQTARGDLRVGVIGVTTIDTPRTTLRANLEGLVIAPLADRVRAEAAALRKRGAAVVVLVAHAGGRCRQHDAPEDLSSCDPDAEIFRLARALPPRTVDAIVSGHTHAPVSHIVNGVPIIEAWANGRGFGRVDLDVDLAGKAPPRVVRMHPPRAVCANDDAPIAACAPPPYEGQPVIVDAALLEKLAPMLAAAKAARARPLGVTVTRPVQRSYDEESPLGNLFADLMLEASADLPAGRADVAMMNGGGIRASLPAGPLTYGHIYEMMPFDNRFAHLTLTGAQVRMMLERNLSARQGGITSIAGLEVEIACDGPRAHITLRRKGVPVPDDAPLRVVMTDYVATGGDAALDGVSVEAGNIVLDQGEPVREHLARLLEKRGGTLDGASPALFDPTARRLKNRGQTTARCRP